ncbi:hypothetical protein E0K83_01535 [Gramella sp. BOM4]|nr:hypothetical protein [Christiangramia bathymodioli]
MRCVGAMGNLKKMKRDIIGMNRDTGAMKWKRNSCKITKLSFRKQSEMERLKKRKEHLIFYFYLIRKFSSIKENIKEIREQDDRNQKPFYLEIFEYIGIAAGLTVLIYYMVIFVYLGELRWPTTPDWIQMGLEFLFILSLFWSHRQIAYIFRKKPILKSSPILRGILEMAAVILSAILLHYLINYFPISLIYSPENFNPVNVRNGYVIGIILALFFYYFVEMRKREKQLQAEKLRSARLQKENFQAQLEGLKQQVNPHFLFNSLNVLGSLVYSDKDKAVNFIRKLSDLYRSYLENGEEVLLSLKKEIEVCRAYTYLLETRFGEAVKFSFHVSEEKMMFQVPPGSVQMLIENAVKHNGSTPSRPLEVTITIEDNYLVVRNKINPRRENIPSTKTGLENIKNRYRYLTDKEIKINKSEKEFEVKLPLLKVEEHESSHH